MGNPSDKVSGGQKLRISARALNDMLDVVAWWKGQRGGKNPTPDQGGDWVLIQNLGDDVDRFGVLGINDVLINPNDSLPDFQSRIALTGAVPRLDTHLGLFVVTLEPIEAGKIGRARLDGAIQVQIQVTADTKGMLAADVLDGDVTQLALTAGGFRVRWIDDYDSGAGGSQTLWGIVQLGQPEGILEAQMDASEDGTHPAGQTKKYHLLTPPTSTAVVQVINKIKDVKADARGMTALIRGVNGKYELVAINACGNTG